MKLLDEHEYRSAPVAPLMHIALLSSKNLVSPGPPLLFVEASGSANARSVSFAKRQRHISDDIKATLHLSRHRGGCLFSRLLEQTAQRCPNPFLQQEPFFATGFPLRPKPDMRSSVCSAAFCASAKSSPAWDFEHALCDDPTMFPQVVSGWCTEHLGSPTVLPPSCVFDHGRGDLSLFY